MYLKFILFVLYTAHTEAKCPDVRSAHNLNMTTFATGIWSDLARYPNEFETAEECLSLKYSLNGDVFKFDNTKLLEDKRNFMSVFGKVQPDNKILLNASIGNPRKNFEVLLTILFLDDDQKYAIKYNCTNDENNNAKERFWIVSRIANLEGADKDELLKFLEKHSDILDMNKLIWIKYSDDLCN